MMYNPCGIDDIHVCGVISHTKLFIKKTKFFSFSY